MVGILTSVLLSKANSKFNVIIVSKLNHSSNYLLCLIVIVPGISSVSDSCFILPVICVSLTVKYFHVTSYKITNICILYLYLQGTIFTYGTDSWTCNLIRVFQKYFLQLVVKNEDNCRILLVLSGLGNVAPLSLDYAQNCPYCSSNAIASNNTASGDGCFIHVGRLSLW